MSWHVLNKLKALFDAQSTTLQIVKDVRAEQRLQRKMLEHMMTAQDNMDKAIADLQASAGTTVAELHTLRDQITLDAAQAGIPQDKVQGWADSISNIVANFQSNVAAVSAAAPAANNADAPVADAPSTGDDPSKAPTPEDQQKNDQAAKDNDAGTSQLQKDQVQKRNNTDGGLGSRLDKAGVGDKKRGGNPGVTADTTT